MYTNTCDLKYVTLHEIFGPAALTSFFRNRDETKIIKLRLETRLKSQASDWLKWRPGLVSKLSFMILGLDQSAHPRSLIIVYTV